MFTRNYYLASLFRNTVGEASLSDEKINQIIHRLRNINGELIPSIDEYGIENGGETSVHDNGKPYYCTYHMKVGKSSLICDTKYRNGTINVHYGVCFGNGNAAESFDDYTMSGELFTTYTYSQTRTVSYDDGGVVSTILYTLTNTGDVDFTISEIGMFGYAYMKHKGYSRYYYYDFLEERTVLESPITIPANGGVGQVTYTLRSNYPKV